MADERPVLELHGSANAVIATNDNWKDAQQNAIAQSGLAPGSGGIVP